MYVEDVDTVSEAASHVERLWEEDAEAAVLWLSGAT